MGDMESLVERITADPGFADRLRADPVEVLRSVGIEPTADLVEAVSSATGSEVLAARISKAYRIGK